VRARLLEQAAGHRTFFLAFDKDDDVEPVLLRFAAEQKIAAAELRGIGGFSAVTLAYFERSTLKYEPIPLHEQVEVVAITGNISRVAGDGDSNNKDGQLKLHAHVVIGRRDGSAMAGHLVAARVWPTMEIFLTAYSEPLERKPDPETGLPLL